MRMNVRGLLFVIYKLMPRAVHESGSWLDVIRCGFAWLTRRILPGFPAYPATKPGRLVSLSPSLTGYLCNLAVPVHMAAFNLRP